MICQSLRKLERRRRARGEKPALGKDAITLDDHLLSLDLKRR